MTETSAGLAAIVATVSATLLAVFGVDYYSLLGGLVGAMLALGASQSMSRGGAVLFVMLSMFAGAVIGSVAATYFAHPPRALVIGLCIVGGVVAQAIASALLAAAPRLTKAAADAVEKRFGGGAKQ
jgi:hypothetical protein